MCISFVAFDCRGTGIDRHVPNRTRWKAQRCDFEIHNAYLNIALNMLRLQVVIIAACHEHYCSSTIIKKIKNFGLAGGYANDESRLKTF